MIAVALLVVAGPLLNAHAHNDYEHRRPLLDAISHGFTSVEADVFLVDGRLLVAHDRSQLKLDRSLKALYLEPLAKLIREKAAVYPGVEFTLMVDIKADGREATEALVRELEPYRSFISATFPKAVKVVVSGAGDREVVATRSGRLLSMDGRPPDLEKPRDPSVAWVSDSWANHFTWKGEGSFPHDERMKLREMAFKAQQLGYRLRFWASPETPAVWEELVRGRVDLIGTDRLGDLAKYLKSQRAE
jgi:hypothetical protein